MTGAALIGLAFGVGYAWANLGRRFHPISYREIFWGGEPTIRADGTYSDVSSRNGGWMLLYRANDGEILDGGMFRTARAAKAWRPDELKRDGEGVWM